MQEAASKESDLGGGWIIINEIVKDGTHLKKYFQTRKETCLDLKDS